MAKAIEVGVHSYPVKRPGKWRLDICGCRSPEVYTGMPWINREVVARMKELGYDATYVNEDEGRSIFVVDSKQIYPVK